MSIRIFQFTFWVVLFSILSACSLMNDKEEKVELTISAAASLSGALSEIKEVFEAEHPNVLVMLNLGGTGSLQQQIIQGAPVDMFISASRDQFNELLEMNMIDKNYQRKLLGNALVLIKPKHSEINLKTFEDLTSPSVRKIAIGMPETVPAGMYAKQTLQSQHLWSGLQQKILSAKDVRQVLTYVETGNVDAGLVYKTDAKTSQKVEIIAFAKKNSHDPIIYPAGIIKASKHQRETVLFYNFLQSELAREIFTKYGFTVLD